MLLDFRRINILNYLLDYRAMNVKQMTTLIYMTTHYTNSNLKQVQRELKELKDKGLVTTFLYSEPLIDNEGVYKTQKVSMYYLTAKGYNNIMEYYDIIAGQQGTGYLLTDDFIYGDIPYEVYKPPTVLIEHHMMGINTFIKLCLYGNKFPHRNNLYAAKKVGENKKLRPDAEVLINNKNYFLEFDRNTESHEKLVEKFSNYSDYFDSLTKEELEKQGKIIFLVDKEIGIKRRWNNLLSAYFKGLNKYCYRINLILCTEGKIIEVLNMEKDIEELNIDHKLYLTTLDAAEDIRFIMNKIVLYKNAKNQTLKFTMLLHEYDSSIITNFSSVLNYINNQQEYKLDPHVLLIKDNLDFNWMLNLRHYKVQKNITDIYDKLLGMKMKVVPYQKLILREYDKEGNIIEDMWDI